MPDGLILVAAGLACLVVFVAIVSRHDRQTGGIARPGWDGWLVLGLSVACLAGGVLLAAGRLFSG